MKQLLGRFILSYLRALSRLQLRKNRRAVIIGITGSAGKTSTRLALAKILSARGRVKHSVHANSESGIPLNILGLSLHSYTALDWLRVVVLTPLMLLFNWQRFDYYIVEMGIDSPAPPKNMSYLLRIIRPHVGVVLNAGLVHGAAFDFLVKDRNPVRRAEKVRAEIAKEKMLLAKNIDPTGVAIINADEKLFTKSMRDIAARCLTFGKSASANLRLLKVANSRNGFSLRFVYQNQTYDLELPSFFAEEYAYTFAAAICTAASLGVSPRSSLEALSGFRAPAGRLRLFPGINESKIIDSSYNASPDAVRSTLELLSALAGRARKIAVIGDMRELGLQEKLAHKNLAEWLVKSCDEAILYGQLTAEYTLPVLKSRRFPVHHFTHMSALIQYLRSRLKPKAWVLVKGSQNTIFLERAVAGILANPHDLHDLCRRGKYWDSLRAKTP